MSRKSKDGSPVLNAIALVGPGSMTARRGASCPWTACSSEIGIEAEAPAAAPEVEAFLRAEETLKSAA